MFSPHVEQCIGGGVEYMAWPLESKYPGFDWVVCRTRLPSLPTRTAGIWIPIAGFDGCRIDDEAGFTYELQVGKKYQMLKPLHWQIHQTISSNLSSQSRLRASSSATAVTNADRALFDWILDRDYTGISLDKSPHVNKWLKTLSQRPAFQKGRQVP
ncbi:hypothetical protein TRIATDRAFT_272002 [Trichoderma atroviride IMI 206040]|uniref:Uncharacterized protein n=1 Tax=Hypocrea atroviridis (strain ATCC 20476 / IMI 206040) TaxID=452589 RepID=G9NML3_HYPAI|nr:uncharacterized protein TRIATDRAFT_272002 [Trichoderma atroviride IMI 206040]EHK48143.1 hypothetical protein TRIATDRAFT_272002 [Trichoderma atroviride IMI 206040]